MLILRHPTYFSHVLAVTQRCIYILFDGLTYNTRGYFVSCVVFFRVPKGRGKIQAKFRFSSPSARKPVKSGFCSAIHNFTV